MPLVVGEALSVVWQEPPVSKECTASCGTRSSALDHLPESVAGAAVFDPMPRVGSAVGLSNDVQLRCCPMVHEGWCKHPALHLRYHLQVRLNTVPGGGGRHKIRCRHPSTKLFV